MPKTQESWASSPATRRSMQSNRSKDTSPERRLRSALHQRGFRFRKHVQVLQGRRGKPDVIFPRQKVAVFVDGCFWHGCPTHGTTPKTHTEYWGEKIERNRRLDTEVDASLIAQGWTVLRFWEHEPSEVMAEAVARVLKIQRGRGEHP